MIELMREHRKTLLIIFVVIFGVCFGLPSYMGRNRNRALAAREVGSYAGPDGTMVVYTSQEVSHAAVQLKCMLDLQVPLVLTQMAGYEPTMALINPLASYLTCNAVFGDDRTAYMTRSYLADSARYAAEDSQDLDAIYSQINKLIDDNRQTADNFIILAAEAHRNGYYATQSQIDFVTEMARAQVNQNKVKLSSVLTESGLTLGLFQKGLSDLISIVLYVDEMTKIGSVNENEVRSKVRESSEANKMTGKFAEFNAGLFVGKVGEPTEEEIIAQFDKFKAVDPRSIKADDETNIFGFSYMLPDRLQVEYLDVNVSLISKKLTDEFSARPATEQEDELQKYWSEHKSEADYQRTMPAAEGQEPVKEQMSYDDCYAMVRMNYINGQAQAQAKTVMASIRDEVRNSDVLVQSQIDWKAVADKLGDKVVYGISEYLSYETINNYARFGTAKVTMMNNAPLAQVLFASEPMRDEPASKRDTIKPLKEREPLVFVEAGYGTNISNIYAIRIVGTDRAREAVSINDDGRQGKADVAPLADEKNILKDQVKEDLNRVKAFDMAKAKAMEFLELAKTDWNAAVEKVGDSLKSEGSTINPINVKEVDSIYEQIKMIREFMQQSPDTASRYESSLTYFYKSLNGILSDYRKAGSGEFLVNISESESIVRVFEKLEITPANQDDWLKGKGTFVIQNQQRSQFKPLLNLFMQNNIDTRNAYKSLYNDSEEEQDSAPAAAATK